MKIKLEDHEQLAEINPVISGIAASHYFKIHHDFFINYETKEVDRTVGHFYIELVDGTSGATISKGKNPSSIGMPVAFGKIQDESGRFNVSKPFGKVVGCAVLTTKVVPLTPEQYASALTFMNTVNPGIYIGGVDDCIEFTQNAYNAAGLPRYFTEVFSMDELLGLGGLASKSALARFGCSDTNAHVSNSILTAAEVAAKYHVPIERVVEGADPGHIHGIGTRGEKSFVILSQKAWNNLAMLKDLGGGVGKAEGELEREAADAAEFAANLAADTTRIMNAPKAMGDTSSSVLADETDPRILNHAKAARETMDWATQLRLDTMKALGMSELDRSEATASGAGSSARERDDGGEAALNQMVKGMFWLPRNFDEARGTNMPFPIIPNADSSTPAVDFLRMMCVILPEGTE